MSSNGNTSRPLPSLILLGIFDFVCILNAGELYKDKHVIAGTWWLLAGVVFSLIGYYWTQVKRALVNAGTWFKKKPSKLVIHAANYAAWSGQGKHYDVTKYLQSIVTGDSLVFDRIENHSFWVDGQNLVTEDPLFGKAKKLEVTYSYNGEPPKTIRRTEHDRLTLPEDSAMAWLGKELNNAKAELDRLKAAQPKPSQYPIPEVRMKILSIVSELQGFLGAHGDEPVPVGVHREPGESREDFLARFRARPTEPMMKWRAGFLGDYRQQFKDKVSDLRDEMRSRAHIDDPRLNTAIGGAENESNNGVAAVNAVIERLWELALKVNV
ncbi:MAG: hypothetical protein WBQ43_05840 [Terriglobales bacterium]